MTCRLGHGEPYFVRWCPYCPEARRRAFWEATLEALRRHWRAKP